MAKRSVGQQATQFLAQFGTAGGPVGAMNTPGLVAFGTGDISRQLTMGNTDYYGTLRSEAVSPMIGAPNGAVSPGLQSAPTMPPNLDTGYIRLNVPGSPLPMYGLMAAHSAKAAQVTQDNIRAMDQRMLTAVMPPTGQLPITPMQAAVGAAQQLRSKAAKQRSGGR